MGHLHSWPWLRQARPRSRALRDQEAPCKQVGKAALTCPPGTNSRRSRSKAEPHGRRYLFTVLTVSLLGPQVLHLQIRPAQPRIKNI